MTRFLAAFIAVFFMSACISIPTRDAYDQMLNQTVLLIGEYGGNGTGVVVGDGLIVTAKHVARRSLKAEYYSGSQAETKLIRKSEHADLALLGADTTGQPIAAINCDAVQIGEPLIAVGSPMGSRWVVTHGRVGSLRRVSGDNDPDNYFLADLAINPGNSGGPVFNSDFELVGIATGFMGFGGGPFSRPSGNSGVSVIATSADVCALMKG